jgi:hypothetical protein
MHTVINYPSLFRYYNYLLKHKKPPKFSGLKKYPFLHVCALQGGFKGRGKKRVKRKERRRRKEGGRDKEEKGRKERGDRGKEEREEGKKRQLEKRKWMIGG